MKRNYHDPSMNGWRDYHPQFCIFNPEILTIDIYEEGRSGISYQVDLEECVDSAELLDFIFQVNDKTWFTSEMTYELLWSLEFACHKVFNNNLQGVYCPCGRGNKVNWKKKTYGLKEVNPNE